MSRSFTAAIARLTTSTFSCDIARAVSRYGKGKQGAPDMSQGEHPASQRPCDTEWDLRDALAKLLLPGAGRKRRYPKPLLSLVQAPENAPGQLSRPHREVRAGCLARPALHCLGEVWTLEPLVTLASEVQNTRQVSQKTAGITCIWRRRGLSRPAGASAAGQRPRSLVRPAKIRTGCGDGFRSCSTASPLGAGFGARLSR